MPKNSKQIGGAYEREIAVKLSNWLTGNPDGDLVCWRAPHSGSVGTNRKKKGMKGDSVSGDFQCLDSKYEEFFNLFHCDSKSLGDVHLMLINENNIKSSQLFNNWIKVCQDAGENKFPLMFVKARNDRRICDFVCLSSYTNFNVNSKIFFSFFFENKKYELYLVTQDQFFTQEYKQFLRGNLL